MWPWVSSKLVEAANSRAQQAEDQSRHTQADIILLQSRISNLIKQAEDTAIAERTERESLREENRKLIDRIVEMTGQPPIYRPTPAVPPAAPPQEQTSSVPAPRTRVTPEDIHRAARTAINEGKLHTLASGAK